MALRSRADAVEPSPISKAAPPPDQTERTDTGIGRALRLARQRLGRSLDDATRDTRVQRERLEALEDERFEDLGGDVYVRSLLRSYAKYLELDPSKVIRYFEGMYRSPPAPPAPVEEAPGVGPTEAVVLTGGNRRPSWLLAAIIAGLVLAAGGAIGILSRSTSAPEPADGITVPSIPAEPPGVRVDLTALDPVRIEVIVDDADPIRDGLRQGDIRTFEGEDSVKVRISFGRTVELAVNGGDPFVPGKIGQPFMRTYTPEVEP